MGQFTSVSSPGITVTPIDRETGPGAGPGSSGNRCIFLGADAGKNSAIDDFIAIGNETGGAIVGFTDAGLTGSVIIGTGNFPRNVNATTDAVNVSGAIIGIGHNIAPNVTAGARMAGVICIGENILASAVMDAGGGNFSRNIYIGDGVMYNNLQSPGFGSSDNIFIGHNVAQTTAGNVWQHLRAVIVGSQSVDGVGGHLSDTTVIGSRSGRGLTFSTNNTIVGGDSCNALGFSADNVVIGALNVLSGSANRNVLVGSQIGSNTINDAVLIGFNQTTLLTGDGSIYIGSGAGSLNANNVKHRFLVESNIGSVRAMMYGDMNAGNIILGNSNAAQRALIDGPAGATNIVQLANGSASGTNPVNGGYFYVNAGALHWVGSAGTDTMVAVA